MKKFNFSLDALQRYRGSMEEISMREFADELKRFNYNQNSVLRLREERQRIAEEVESIKKSDNRRLELSLYTTYISDLREFIKEKEALLDECRKELEIKRRALMEVMKDRKVLDVMRERQFEEHRAESLRKEQKTLDDMAGSRFYLGGADDEN